MIVSTILLILKILLIIILSILGLLLFIVLLILLWPFCYKLSLNKADGINVSLNISFFFHFISVWAIYDKNFNIKAKLLGITIFDKSKRKKEAESDSDNLDDFDSFEEYTAGDNSNNDKDDINKNDINKNDINKDNIEIDSNDNGEFQVEKSAQLLDKLKDKERDKELNKESDNNSDNVEKKSIFDKIEDFIDCAFAKIENFSGKIISFIENFSDNTSEKINKIEDTINYYNRLLNSKGSEKVIEFLKKKIIQLLKSIKPRKGRINLIYGSEDPCKVGKVFEIYSLLSPFLPKKSKLTADFERNVFEFDSWLKGYLCLGYIGIIALEVLLNKKLKKFIKLLKREEN